MLLLLMCKLQTELYITDLFIRSEGNSSREANLLLMKLHLAYTSELFIFQTLKTTPPATFNLVNRMITQ